MTTLTKSEATALLRISDSTLTRRMKKGVYTFTRGDGQFDPVLFTYEGLGLVEPTSEPTPAVAEVQPTPVHGAQGLEPTPECETFKPRQLSSLEQKASEDAAFASAYLRGEACDSLGNTIHGNDRFPTLGKQTALGPIVHESSAPVESQSHIPAGLLGTNDSTGNPVDRGHNPIDHATEGSTTRGLSLAYGMTQETYDQMMRSNRQSHNVRS